MSLGSITCPGKRRLGEAFIVTGFCAMGDQLRTLFKLRSCGITSCAPSGQPLLLRRTRRSARNRGCSLSPARLKPTWLSAQKAPKPVMCTDASAAGTRATVSRRPWQRSQLDGGYGPTKTASTVVTIIQPPEPRPKPCNGCGLERGASSGAPIAAPSALMKHLRFGNAACWIRARSPRHWRRGLTQGYERKQR